jgi:hypothetical protein
MMTVGSVPIFVQETSSQARFIENVNLDNIHARLAAIS